MKIGNLAARPPPCSYSRNHGRGMPHFKVRSANQLCFASSFCLFNSISREKNCFVSSALPETAVSVLVTSLAVGVAATLLAKRTNPSDKKAITENLKACEDCGGSGICSECNGEGFVFKKLSNETAEKGRKAAKNYSTRYTAGLPTKWTYCTKCSSARSCNNCKGSGQIAL